MRLLSLPYSKKLHIVALVRSAGKARKLAHLGVEAVVGSLDDVRLVRTLAREADVVFDCVSRYLYFTGRSQFNGGGSGRFRQYAGY